MSRSKKPHETDHATRATAAGHAAHEPEEPTIACCLADPGEIEAALRERIAVKAFHLWENRGRPHGDGLEDWVEAERQVRSEGLEAARLAKETSERRHAEDGRPTARERMVSIGRGNRQAGRQK